MTQNFRACHIEQLDGRHPIFSFRCNWLAYCNRDDAPARKPVAVTQHRARATYAYRNDGHPSLGGDYKCAHAEWPQAGDARESALRKEQWRAPGLQRAPPASHLLRRVRPQAAGWLPVMYRKDLSWLQLGYASALRKKQRYAAMHDKTKKATGGSSNQKPIPLRPALSVDQATGRISIRGACGLYRP